MVENADHTPFSFDPAEVGRIRRTIQRQFSVEASAWSSDGAVFGYQSSIVEPLPLGSYVVITTDDDRQYVGQIESADMGLREGPQLEMTVSESLGFVDVTGARTQVRVRSVEGEGTILGRLDGAAVVDAALGDRFDGADLRLAPPEVVAAVLSGERSTLEVGRLALVDEVPLKLDARGLTRHAFLCGQSGSGKTYSLGVVLEQLLLGTDLPLVLLDPNSDFVHLGETDPAIDVQVPKVHLRFSNLPREDQATVLGLHPLDDREEYSNFRTLADRFGDEPYSLAAISERAAEALHREIALRIKNLGVADWELWSEPDEEGVIDLVDAPPRALVLDLGTLPTPAQRSVVAAATLGHLWRNRHSRRSVLIVIDEAHNVCPAEPTDAIQAIATEHAIRIAGEGRKFGLHMLVATQRPQKIHPNVLSQCGNLVLMRMNSESDLAVLSEVFSHVPAAMFGLATRFSLGEALIAGRVVPGPVLARFGTRISREGGADPPTTWAR